MIWLTALSVYVLAVFDRSSLGVASLLATQRFGITATQLSFFVVLQRFAEWRSARKPERASA